MGVGQEEGAGMGEEEGAGLGEEAEPGEAAGELAEGMQEEGETLQDTRDDVADELGIPTDAVVFGPDVRQSIIDAKSDFDRKTWGTVGAIENQLTNINMQDLEAEERQAATDLQNQITQVQQNLKQMGQASEQQAEQMQSQLEKEVEEIRQNWEKVSEEIQLQEQPAGGGPMEGQQQPMEGEQPMEGMEGQQPMEGMEGQQPMEGMEGQQPMEGQEDQPQQNY